MKKVKKTSASSNTTPISKKGTPKSRKHDFDSAAAIKDKWSKKGSSSSEPKKSGKDKKKIRQSTGSLFSLDTGVSLNDTLDKTESQITSAANLIDKSRASKEKNLPRVASVFEFQHSPDGSVASASVFNGNVLFDTSVFNGSNSTRTHYSEKPACSPCRARLLTSGAFIFWCSDFGSGLTSAWKR